MPLREKRDPGRSLLPRESSASSASRRSSRRELRDLGVSLTLLESDEPPSSGSLAAFALTRPFEARAADGRAAWCVDGDNARSADAMPSLSKPRVKPVARNCGFVSVNGVGHPGGGNFAELCRRGGRASMAPRQRSCCVLGPDERFFGRRLPLD